MLMSKSQINLNSLPISEDEIHENHDEDNWVLIDFEEIINTPPVGNYWLGNISLEICRSCGQLIEKKSDAKELVGFGEGKLDR